MGNTQSSKDKKSLSQIIDYIATNYILTQNFNDMKKLSDVEYCNKLVVITADIIAKNLKDKEISFLSQRMENGVEINEMKKEKVIFLKKNNLESLDITNATDKRRACIGIAKFYVLVAHIFSAIVTTINPVYSYKDSQGSTIKASLLDKQYIPKDVKTKIKKINICSQRLNALINNQDYNVSNSDQVTIKPKFCGMNYDANRGRDRNLSEEPGIPELEKLYFDVYNSDTGGFTKMSQKMMDEIYTPDVKRFYTAFTGNENIPNGKDGKPIIKKFSDIPLRDFHRSKGCSKDGVFNSGYTGTLKNKLFANYAEHLKEMMQTTTDNQTKLVDILDSIFVIAYNPRTQRKETVIKPTLKYSMLEDIVSKTRNIIVDLYIRCEDDFVKGLQLFEAIVEKQIMDTSQAQIKRLEATIQESIVEPPSEVNSNLDAPVQLGLENERPERPEDKVFLDENNMFKSEEKPFLHQPALQQLFLQQPALQQPFLQQHFLQQPALQQPELQQPELQQPALHQPALQQHFLQQQALFKKGLTENKNVEALDINNIIDNKDIKQNKQFGALYPTFIPKAINNPVELQENTDNE